MSEFDPHIELRWRRLAAVIDPELRLDFVSLGLVYRVEVRAHVARITHTLTTQGCPMEPLITEAVRTAAMSVDDIRDVETVRVWEPAWHAGMIASNAW